MKFKLAFLFVVLMAVVVTSNPHPRQNHSKNKKVSALTKPRSVAHHHGPESHNGKPSAKRVTRSHGAGYHAPVHHPHQGKVTQHLKKFSGKRTARGIHGAGAVGGGGGGSHGHGHGHSDNKASFVRPVKKNRGHRK